MRIIYWAYFLLVGLLSIFVVRSDKRRAQKGKWRISEKTLWMLGAAGGALPMLLAMLAFRHKTQKKKFMVGLPLMILLQIPISLFLYLLLKSWINTAA